MPLLAALHVSFVLAVVTQTKAALGVGWRWQMSGANVSGELMMAQRYTYGILLAVVLFIVFVCCTAEIEKHKNIAQTQILDQKMAQITRNSGHIIIHVKRA